MLAVDDLRVGDQVGVGVDPVVPAAAGVAAVRVSNSEITRRRGSRSPIDAPSPRSGTGIARCETWPSPRSRRWPGSAVSSRRAVGFCGDLPSGNGTGRGQNPSRPVDVQQERPELLTDPEACRRSARCRDSMSKSPPVSSRCRRVLVDDREVDLVVRVGQGDVADDLDAARPPVPRSQRGRDEVDAAAGSRRSSPWRRTRCRASPRRCRRVGDGGGEAGDDLAVEGTGAAVGRRGLSTGARARSQVIRTESCPGQQPRGGHSACRGLGGCGTGWSECHDEADSEQREEEQHQC